MNYDMKAPCKDCPFLRDGGIRLSQGRIKQIAEAALSSQGSTFQCHNTAEWDDEGEEVVRTARDQHCVGALIFALKHETLNQPARIAYALRMFDPKRLMADPKVVGSIFDSVEEMAECSERFFSRKVGNAMRTKRPKCLRSGRNQERRWR